MASAWIGRIYKASKHKPPARFAASLLIYRDKVNTWVIGYYLKGKYYSDYQTRRALYWYPVPPLGKPDIESMISVEKSDTRP